MSIPAASPALARRALYAQASDGTVTVVFGPAPGDVVSAAAAEMAASRGGAKPGARAVGDGYLVRQPLGNGQAHLWLVEGGRTLTAEDFVQLARDAAALSAPDTGDDQIATALASLPRLGKRRRLRAALEAIAKATGWTGLMAIPIARGRARTPVGTDQHANPKRASLRIFAGDLALSGDRTLTATTRNPPDDPGWAVFMDQHDVASLAMAAPAGDGIALYAEGAITEAEIQRARTLLSLAMGVTDSAPRRGWTWVWMTGALAALAVFLAWPVRLELGAPAELEPARSEMVVLDYEARLTTLSVRVGDEVAAGAPIARFASTELVEQDKRAAMDQMLEALAAQEALASDDYAAYQLAEQRRAIATFRAEQSQRRLAALSIAAPRDGRVAFVVPERQIGTVLPAGAPVAEIQSGHEMRARLNLSSADAALIRPGMSGTIIVRGIADGTFAIDILDTPVVTATRDGTETLTVLARVHAPPEARLLKGLTGYARLDAGTRTRAEVLARPIVTYLRFSAWKYLGLPL